MSKFFKSRLVRSIMPYFILGIFLIVAFRVIMGIEFLSEHSKHFRHFWGVITPFLAGGIIAYILNLPCSAIQKLLLKIDNRFVQKRSRGLSVLATVIIVVVLIIFSVNMIAPRVTESITAIVTAFDEYEDTVRGWIETVDGWDLPDFIPEIDEDMLIGIATDFITDIDVDSITASIMAGIGATLRGVFNTILAIIASIYFLIEKDRLKEYLKRGISALVTDKTNDLVLKYSRKLHHNFHMYIYTQTIDGIILGSLMIGLLLIFRSPHALLLGLILGVVNYIPYFGSIFGTIFAVIVVAFTQSIPTAALAAVFMFILQQVDGNFIQPRLMGGSFSLSPLLVIISVTIGMAYGGMMGMLVAIPIVAILKDILDEYIEHREYKKLNPEPSLTEDIMNREIY
ncbi:MAG: AI-2E family transporter [Defluviitaleaceae bacterium]|nr:AI-2E family transporter [Defluviitaleaceae bacterium]